jgi:hypothetical protein
VVARVDFGGIVCQAGGGRVTLTANGSLLPEGYGVFRGAAPASSYGRIRLSGPPNGSFQFTLTPASPVLHGPGGATLNLASFQFAAPVGTGKFPRSGILDVAFGGTLDLPAGSPQGLYTAQVVAQLSVPGFPAVTQLLPITCRVRSPLVLTCPVGLWFGSIFPAGGGIVKVSPFPGTASWSSGPKLAGGTIHPATLQLTGPPTGGLNLVLPSKAVLDGPSGATLEVTDFTCDQDLRQGMPSSGLTFHVGASLHVAPDQVLGHYHGTVQVGMAYR